MAHDKKTPIVPSKTSHLFGGRKPNDRGAGVTSERIAADIAAFNQRGGHIEVLGNTRSLKKIGVTEELASESAVAVEAPTGRQKRTR